ncbi:hypothetical protein BD779DRAFT_1510328 [Infundibulicybe gibba]|nr:hypothetical protein BD779DRAFT_1510328 [Infundibulicybe gibba]
MGASQSTATEPKIYHSETPIQFSQDVVNQLADQLESPEISPERQSTLDAHIRSRIQGELQHLKKEEEEIKHEIESALERENLDREASSVGDGSEAGDVKTSAALLGDLEEIRSKVDRFNARKSLDAFPEVKASGEAVISCYKNNPSTPLDCWHEVTNFKAMVAKVEEEYFKTLH